MAVEFVPITKDKQRAMVAIECGAYQLRDGLYEDYNELKVLLGQQAARQYSFLLRDGDYRSYCIASLQDSLVQQETALYISDFAVRGDVQQSYYGLAMAEELLRRAYDNDVPRIEFHARGSTSHGAITTSRHTNEFLERYHYQLDEVSVSDIYMPTGKWEESFHLISLEKIVPNHL